MPDIRFDRHGGAGGLKAYWVGRAWCGELHLADRDENTDSPG